MEAKVEVRRLQLELLANMERRRDELNCAIARIKADIQNPSPSINYEEIDRKVVEIEEEARRLLEKWDLEIYGHTNPTKAEKDAWHRWLTEGHSDKDYLGFQQFLQT